MAFLESKKTQRFDRADLDTLIRRERRRAWFESLAPIARFTLAGLIVGALIVALIRCC